VRASPQNPSRRWPLVGGGSLVAGLALVTVAVGGLTACAAPGSNDPRPSVVVGAYPFAYAAQAVAGPDARVVDLAPPGGEPHDLEIGPQEMAQVVDASTVVTVPGFQPALDAAITNNVEASHVLDLANVVTLLPAPTLVGAAPVSDHTSGATSTADSPETTDPHVWLDPTNLAAIAQAVAGRLAAADPAHAADYRRRAGQFTAQMARLDREYRRGLADCQRRSIVTSHAAFGYLAARYGLTQIAVTGLDPESEPSGAQLAAVVDAARAAGVTTVFTESGANAAATQTLAAELDVKVATLNAVEFVTDGQTYASLMRENLAALRAADTCGPAKAAA
jgi:zinc transport system substrate-binding protein